VQSGCGGAWWRCPVEVDPGGGSAWWTGGGPRAPARRPRT
jgi:hypothetical protein